MKKLLCLLILLIVLVSTVGAQENLPTDHMAAGLRPEFQADLNRLPDVPLYEFDLVLEPDFEQTTISGTGSITYTNTTPDTLSNIVLRLYPNLVTFGGEAVLENVMINGILVSPSLDETLSVVRLILPEALPPLQTITITFDYGVIVYHGRTRLYNQFSYLERELALASVLPLLSVYEPYYQDWWAETAHPQGDAVYSETGNFDVRLRYPDYLTMVTSGSEVGAETSADGEWTTSHYVAPLMRDFAIMASRDYQVISGQVNGVQVNVYYLPTSADAAPEVLDFTMTSVEAFDTYYGAYVYSELDVVETYTTAGGIEYPGLFVVASRFWEPGDNFLQVITVHEAAHQWWYSMVGNDQTFYPWLDEALTDYSVAQWYRYTGGAEGYRVAINAFASQYQSYEDQFGEKVIGDPATGYSEYAYSPIVYRKGAYFFHILAETMGMDTLLAGLQIYLETYRYQTATPNDLQTVLETVSGQELDDLFVEWVGYSN